MFAALVLLPVACSRESEEKDKSAPAKQIKFGDLTFNDHGTQDTAGKSSVALEADNFYFEPTFIRGTPGQKLTIQVESEANTPHNLSVADQSIDKNIDPKAKVTVDVAIPQLGVLRFFCKFHANQGMNGELLAGSAQPQPVALQSGTGQQVGGTQSAPGTVAGAARTSPTTAAAAPTPAPTPAAFRSYINSGY
jgi:plastocyanin